MDRVRPQARFPLSCRPWVWVAPLLLGISCLVAASPPPAPEHSLALANQLKGRAEYHVPPDDALIPNDKYGDEVRLGRKIFTETWKYARRYTGNQLTCANCHMDAGRRANAGPMWATFGMYPAYRRKNDRTSTLEERIQECFWYSMNGFKPAVDAPEVRALVAYMHFLARGTPVGVEMPGRGFPQIVNTGVDPNPTRGGVVYQERCASCHGISGEGVRQEGGGYSFPPLWGREAYNKGAGMARVELLAGYTKANMPPGGEWGLTDQQALDVASYINLQLRPWDPRKGILKGLLD